MSEFKRDMWTASVLLVLSAVWLVAVWQTIPPGRGSGDVGPRAFPLLLGILLAVLAVWQIVSTWMKQKNEQGSLDSATLRQADDNDGEEAGAAGFLTLALTFLHLAAYGFLMQKLGFVLSTFLVIASLMIFCVREKRILPVLSMAVGITGVCWLVFGKLLGVYMATGSWINLG